MATHRRNWNSDFENFAYELYKENEEYFSEEAVNAYDQLTTYANDEIEMLNKRILELEELRDELIFENNELEIVNGELEQQLNEWEMND